MLITALPESDSTHSYDYVVLDDHDRLQSQGSGAAENLPAHAQRVAVLPWSRLSWYAIGLPKLPASQMLSAVIGILEDQWLHRPDQLHLSLHPIAGATPTDRPNFWVCACDAQWLSMALQPLQRAGLMPQRLVPEVAPLTGEQTDTLHLMGQPGQAILAWCRRQGVLCARWPSPWPLLHATPTRVRVDPSLLDLAHSALPTADIQTQTRAERWLEATRLGYDLAQGEWSQTRWQRWRRQCLTAWRATTTQPQWRLARWAFYLMLLAQAGGLLAWAWLTELELQQQKRGLNKILTATFPNTKLVLDAPAQMHQAVQTLRLKLGPANPQQMEEMLAHLTLPLQPAPALKALRFDGQTLNVGGLTLDQLGPAQQQNLRTLGYDLQATPDGLSLRWKATP